MTNQAGRILKQKRNEKGYTLHELAIYLGVHWMTVHKWERGDRTPTDTHKKRIAKFFNSNVESIFFTEDGE